MSMTDEHPLAGELAPAETDDRRLQRLAREASQLEPLRDFTHEPGWTALDAVLEDEETRAHEFLVEGARTHEEFLAYRARIRALRWVRGLPVGTANRLEEIQTEMDRLEQEEENG